MPRPRNPENEGNGVIRISFTIDTKLRRKIRVAAAHADLTPGEWVARVVERAADKATAK